MSEREKSSKSKRKTRFPVGKIKHQTKSFHNFSNFIDIEMSNEFSVKENLIFIIELDIKQLVN